MFQWIKFKVAIILTHEFHGMSANSIAGKLSEAFEINITLLYNITIRGEGERERKRGRDT